MPSKIRWFAIALISLPLVCGCDMADQKVLEGFHQYFPAAYLIKLDPEVLWVQTDVSNISRDFAIESFKSFLAKPEAEQLKLAMPAIGYRAMVLGFSDWMVCWLPQEDKYWVLPPDQSDRWSEMYLGFKFSDKAATRREVRSTPQQPPVQPPLPEPAPSPTDNEIGRCRAINSTALTRSLSHGETLIYQLCMRDHRILMNVIRDQCERLDQVVKNGEVLEEPALTTHKECQQLPSTVWR